MWTRKVRVYILFPFCIYYRFIIRPINFVSMTYVSNWISYLHIVSVYICSHLPPCLCLFLSLFRFDFISLHLINSYWEIYVPSHNHTYVNYYVFFSSSSSLRINSIVLYCIRTDAIMKKNRRYGEEEVEKKWIAARGFQIEYREKDWEKKIIFVFSASSIHIHFGIYLFGQITTAQWTLFDFVSFIRQRMRLTQSQAHTHARVHIVCDECGILISLKRNLLSHERGFHNNRELWLRRRFFFLPLRRLLLFLFYNFFSYEKWCGHFELKSVSAYRLILDFFSSIEKQSRRRKE